MDQSETTLATSGELVEKKPETTEEKLEDRYNKLKVIAVKLKKRVAEQAEEITQLEEVKTRLTEKNQTTLRLQHEFDNAQDEIERLRKAEAQLQKDLKGAVDSNMKLKLADCEKSNQIQSLTTSHKVLREKLDKNEKIEEELSVWKSRATELEKEIKCVKLTDAMQEKRQTAILSLEISDYEKKLQASHETIESLKTQLETEASKTKEQETAIKGLEEKLGTLRAANDKLTNTKESLSNDVLRKSEKISFMQEEISKLNEKLVQKKSELFQLESEYENCKLNLASESKSLVDKNALLQKTITALEQKISALEENKRSRESQINNQKLEMQQLEAEFRNYKIKAQAMLKTQKPDSSNVAGQEKDELENLQRIVQDFNSEISILKSDMQTLRLENENLSMEKAELNLKVKQIKTELLEKEVRSNSETQKLRCDLRVKEAELKKIQEEYSQDRETIATAHKDQLENIRKHYDSKVRALKEQIELYKLETGDRIDSEDGLQRKSSPANEVYLMSDPEKVGFRPITRESPFGCSDNISVGNEKSQQPLPLYPPGISSEQLRMIPRGECEGSESAASTQPQHGGNYNVSFEQLLSSSFDSNSGGASEYGDPCNRSDLAPMVKEELVRCQNQIKHLMVLLRESESNCERLTQLSEALKEEIRRAERDQERKEHLQENSEYLKNVLLKFMTLHGEDERLRLIPVFKTMLKLSGDEVVKLETSVKGNEKNIARDNPNKGWTSYLQTWGT